MAVGQRRIGIIGLKTGKTEHIGHEAFLVIVDTGNSEHILLRIANSPDQTVGISLKTVQDKPVAGNVPSFPAKTRKIPWFHTDTVFEFTF